MVRKKYHTKTARCSICKQPFGTSNMRKSAIASHLKSKKHMACGENNDKQDKVSQNRLSKICGRHIKARPTQTILLQIF